MPDDTRYPRLRSAMDAPYSELSDEALAETMPFLLPGVSAEDAEGFFDGIANAFGQVTKVVQQNPVIGRVLSGAAAGAVPGLAGGPFGALLGAGTGALGALLGGSRTPTGTPPPASGGASGVARQLVGLLARPETVQAITQLAVPGGKQTVAVGRGGTQVPASSFAQLLGFLGSRLAEDADDVPGSTWPPPVGIDSASPADRAGALMSLLALTQPVALPFEPAPTQSPGMPTGGTAAPVGVPAPDERPRARARRRPVPARLTDEAADEAVDAARAVDLEAAALQALARELAS
jgi:hypothetical protein